MLGLDAWVFLLHLQAYTVGGDEEDSCISPWERLTARLRSTLCPERSQQRLTFPFPFVHHQPHDWKVEQLLTVERRTLKRRSTVSCSSLSKSSCGWWVTCDTTVDFWPPVSSLSSLRSGGQVNIRPQVTSPISTFFFPFLRACAGERKGKESW